MKKMIYSFSSVRVYFVFIATTSQSAVSYNENSAFIMEVNCSKATMENVALTFARHDYILEYLVISLHMCSGKYVMELKKFLF